MLRACRSELITFLQLIVDSRPEQPHNAHQRPPAVATPLADPLR